MNTRNRTETVLTVAAVTMAVLVFNTASANAALVGHWTFDNSGDVGEASTSDDLSAVDNAAYSATSQIGGGSLSLDGAGDYLRVDGSDSLPTGVPIGGSAYTVSAWIRPDVTGDRGIVGWGNYGTGNQVNAFRTIGDNGLRHYWWGNDQDVLAGPSDLDDGGWHHVVAAYNTTTGRTIYVDGAIKGTNASTAIASTAQNFRIGSTNFGEFFDGLLDDVAIWNNELSADDITTLYNAGLNGQNAFQAFLQIPEPSTFALATLGLLLLGMTRRRRRNR